MKKAIRTALMTAVVVGSVGLSAAPASAEQCTGVYIDGQGTTNVGTWTCEECPNPSIHGPLDGQFWVVVCGR